MEIRPKGDVHSADRHRFAQQRPPRLAGVLAATHTVLRLTASGREALRAAAEQPLESRLTNRSATVQRSSAACAADCYLHTVPGARNT